MEKNQSKKIYIFFLLLITFILSGSIFLTLNASFVNIRLLSMVLFITVIYYVFPKKPLHKNGVLFIIWTFLFFMTILQRFKTGWGESFGLFSAMVFGMYISQKYNNKDVKRFYINFIGIITLISLIGYSVNNYFFSLNSLLPEYINSNDISFSVGVIYNYITIEPERNCGPFWEPGVFASWIIIAMILLAFERNFPRKKILIIIMILGILSTYSAAGYLLLIFVLIIGILNISRAIRSTAAKNLIQFSLLFSIVILLLFVYPFFERQFENDYYFGELSGNNFWESSRVFSVQQNWKLFLKNPILGLGSSYVETHTTNVGNTSSSMFLIASYGVLGITYTLAFISGIFHQKNVSLSNKIILMVIFLIIINKEPHYEFTWTWVLLFYMLKEEYFFEDNTKCG